MLVWFNSVLSGRGAHLSAGILHFLMWISFMLTLRESLARSNEVWITRWIMPFDTALAHFASGFFFLFLVLQSVLTTSVLSTYPSLVFF